MGMKHGKQHEVLLKREEFFKSEDIGKYYKVAVDVRNWNYEKGDNPLSSEVEYSLEDTNRLNDWSSIKAIYY